MTSLICLTTFALVGQKATIGTGDITKAAIGPAPSHSTAIGNGYTLVKNWDFGSQGTVRNMQEMSSEFQYHDQFKTIANGTNYGAVMVAPTKETALASTPTGPQPIEDPKNPVRQLTSSSLKTFLVPLKGAAQCTPEAKNVGCGSFVAKWNLPKAGSRLGKDLLWETRVRLVTPKYFWYALWICGTKWDKGAEIDLVESFGYLNEDGRTNFDGRFWHSNPVGGSNEIDYWKDWSKGMEKGGVTKFDASEYHTWQLLYRKDDTYSCYMDGREVQRGKIQWTLKGTPTGEPLDCFFLFDGGWGHMQVKSVNKPIDAAEFKGKFFEYDYSRVYLR